MCTQKKRKEVEVWMKKVAMVRTERQDGKLLIVNIIGKGGRGRG